MPTYGNRPLGPLQRNMLAFCQRHPGHHTIHPDQKTIRIARSLEARGLLHVTDCGMCTASGCPVLMVQLAEECQS